MRALTSGMAFVSICVAALAMAGTISAWWAIPAGLVFGVAWGLHDA